MCHFLFVPQTNEAEQIREATLRKPWFGDAIHSTLVGASSVPGLYDGMYALIGLNDICQYFDIGIESLLMEVRGKCIIATRNRILSVDTNWRLGLSPQHFGEHVGLPAIPGMVRGMIYLQASETWILYSGLELLNNLFGFAWIEKFDPLTSAVLFGGRIHSDIWAVSAYVDPVDTGAFVYRLGLLQQQIGMNSAYALIENT